MVFAAPSLSRSLSSACAIDSALRALAGLRAAALFRGLLFAPALLAAGSRLSMRESSCFAIEDMVAAAHKKECGQRSGSEIEFQHIAMMRGLNALLYMALAVCSKATEGQAFSPLLLMH
jgi:hypothetical protein